MSCGGLSCSTSSESVWKVCCREVRDAVATTNSCAWTRRMAGSKCSRPFKTLQDLNLEWVMLDATIIRAHVHTADARKNGHRELGRLRGGFGTKIHAACDELGNLVKFLLTPGQTHDITQAVPRRNTRSLTRSMIATRCRRQFTINMTKRSLHPRVTAKFNALTTNNCIANAITSSDYSRDSSNVGGSPLVMTKPPATSSPSST